MRIVMGVDGGGSKTYAVIVDEAGNKLGDGLSGSGNYERVGVAQAIENIYQSMKLALGAAGLSLDEIDFVQYGLAGADRPKDFVMLRAALSAIPCRAWDLVCDTMEGLRSGSADYTGIVLICGSGTNASGRNKQGEIVQVGGLGEMYGDRAGGEYISSLTFIAAVRSWDGREQPSLLTTTVPGYFGKSSMEELVDDWLDERLQRVPEQLTIALHGTAEEGDELAIRLLRITGDELGLAANAVTRKLGGLGEGDDPVKIVLIGSVLQKGRSPYLLDALKQRIAWEHRNFEVIIPEMAPVYGAVMLAMDRLNITVKPEFEQ